MIPVISDLFEDRLSPLACSIVGRIPVVNHKIDEVHPEINHKDIHYDPYYQSRNLCKSIDEHSEYIN